MGKISVEKCRRYNPEWEKDSRFKEWISMFPNDNTKAFCNFCKRALRPHIADLKQHATTGKHLKNADPELRPSSTFLDLDGKIIEVDSKTKIVKVKMSNITGSNTLKLGFIGAGRMAQALSKGFISKKMAKASNIMASDVEQAALDFIGKLGVSTTQDNSDVIMNSSVIILAVKPHLVEPVLNEASSNFNDDHLVISIAAGITIETLESLLPANTRIIRVMPNTPALVSCGASVFAPNNSATIEDCQLVTKLLSSVGTCDRVDERLVDAVCGLSGSGPAYGFLAIEAMADGGVKMGLPRDLALKLAAQTLMGAAKMVLETGQHPGQLKDAVTSPGGCTINAIHVLESGGFRAALIGAVEASTNKSKEMGGS